MKDCFSEREKLVSKKRISFDVMDDGRLVPKFYQRDVTKMLEVVSLLNVLPEELEQAHLAARALQNVVDGVFQTDEDAPEDKT